jgi:hypothetical protein
MVLGFAARKAFAGQPGFKKGLATFIGIHYALSWMFAL